MFLNIDTTQVYTKVSECSLIRRRGGWVVRGVLLVWIIVGQGTTALAVGAGGGCLAMFFSHLSFSLSLGDGPI